MEGLKVRSFSLVKIKERRPHFGFSAYKPAWSEEKAGQRDQKRNVDDQMLAGFVFVQRHIWRPKTVEMLGQGKISSFFKPNPSKREISSSDESTPPKESKLDHGKKGKSVQLSPEQRERIENNKQKAVASLMKKTDNTLLTNVGTSWFKALESEFSKPYFLQLTSFVSSERDKGKVFPPPDQVFTWTTTCDITDVKVVILGQDPYHGERQAHGLCFSVQKGVTPPPSLKNIYKELSADIEGFEEPGHGTLTGWANQGVLLLNAVLTVRAHSANSHKDKGWEKLTDSVIKWINQNLSGAVFMLWGAYAQKKGAFIDKKKHCVLKSVHPSPLSAHRGFIGCKHFSLANEYLKSQGKEAIDWSNLP